MHEPCQQHKPLFRNSCNESMQGKCKSPAPFTFWPAFVANGPRNFVDHRIGTQPAEMSEVVPIAEPSEAERVALRDRMPEPLQDRFAKGEK